MKKSLIEKFTHVIPILLCFTMICIGILSMNSNARLEGNARVINFTGIIRGGTQKLIKQELMYQPNDALIMDLDNILQGLINGDEDRNLMQLDDENYQAILSSMETEWQNIKKEIINYRNGDSRDHLYELSEYYFTLSDEAVNAAEKYTEGNVQWSRKLMIAVISTFIIIILTSSIFLYRQDKREKKILAIEEENKRKNEQLAEQSKQMLMPINEMTELLYLSDINTYDLLFINDAGKKLFKIENYNGLKCYKAIQGLDKPCDFCTNSKLSNNQTYTWEYTNPIVNRHYLLKDRLINWDGREARMEIAFDITESLNKKKELENRIKIDNILIECVRELYQNHYTVDAVNHVLSLIGTLFEAERAYVFYMENDEMSNIAEWCKDGITPQIDNLQHLSRNDYKWWFKLYDEQASIIIKNIEELKGDRQAEYELLAFQDISRVLLVPFEQYGDFGGMIGLDNLKVEMMESAEKFLRTFSYFIMLSIRRNEDEKTLYQLSYIDKLTKFYNRNRYINDIEELSNKANAVGVAFIDLNGLKEINDRLGHDIGDNLLKLGADIIKKSINNGSFYRIGGDEFVIICLDIEKEKFIEIMQNLKKKLNDGECKAAVGFQWSNTCHQLNSTIKQADLNMYEDKKNFYKINATFNRRQL